MDDDAKARTMMESARKEQEAEEKVRDDCTSVQKKESTGTLHCPLVYTSRSPLLSHVSSIACLDERSGCCRGFAGSAGGWNNRSIALPSKMAIISHPQPTTRQLASFVRSHLREVEPGSELLRWHVPIRPATCREPNARRLLAIRRAFRVVILDTRSTGS